MLNLPTQEFPIEKIKLRKLYSCINEEYNYIPIISSKIKAVYGDLRFKLLQHRPLIVASFVTSIDGKITYPDNKSGTLVAKNNFKDKNGGLADFWLMNILRAAADAVILGTGALRDNNTIVANIFDEDLVNDRLNMQKTPIPINMIVSASGKSLPYDHTIFQRKNIPLVIITTQDGSQYIRKNLSGCNIYSINLQSYEDIVHYPNLIIANNLTILAMGQKAINHKLLFRALKRWGIHKVSVEASYYSYILIKEQLLDEIFLNYSGVFIGGNGPTIGNVNNNQQFFTSLNHPHCKILSLHMHSEYFIYTRQSFDYS